MESLFREIISESERESSPIPQTQSLSPGGLPLSQAASAEKEMTIDLEGGRRTSVSGLSLGGSTGSSTVGVSGSGSETAASTGLGLGYNHLENDDMMMDLSDYLGANSDSNDVATSWSDIGLTLEAFLDILPSTQDVAGSSPTTTNGLWESLEGRVALV